MSFQLSPETVLFDIQNQIEVLKQKIIDAQASFVDVPQPIITGAKNRFLQIIFTTLNQSEINQANDSNTSINNSISRFQTEINNLLNTIPIIEKEMEVRGGIPLETIPIIQPTILSPIIQSITQPSQTQNNNTGLIIAALLAAILIL